MGVRRVGPPAGGSVDPSANKNKPTGRTGNFSEVLATKEQSGNITDLSEPKVKATMAKLLQDRGNSRELVATALRNHPLVRGLPAKTQEDLIKQVSLTMNPFLKGV